MGKTVVLVLCSVLIAFVAILLSGLSQDSQDVQFMLSRRFAYSDLGPVSEFLSLLVSCVAKPLLKLLYSPTSDSFYNREYSFEGIESSLEVHRDNFGVPHIVAANMNDALFAQGFMHAVERPFQMEVMRLAAKGQLASAFGRAALKSDALARAFGFCLDGDAADDVRANEDDLIAYAKGVSSGFTSLPMWPVEFHLIQHKPNPIWTARDCKCLLKMQAVALSHGWTAEYATELLQGLQHSEGTTELHARIIDLLSELTPRSDPTVPASHSLGRHAAVFDKDTQAQVPATTIFGEESDEDLLNGVKVPNAVPVPAEAVPVTGTDNNANGKTSFLNGGGAEPIIMAAASGVGGAAGSNAWVLSGEHTASGAPLLAADPHLQLTVPSIVMPVYIAVQNGRDGLRRLVGAASIGMPGVILGRNERFAWGMTLSYFDKDDLYLLTTGTCPNNPQKTCYLYDGDWYPFQEREELIYVKGTDTPVPVTIRMSHHGPVLSDHLGALMNMIHNKAGTGGIATGTDKAAKNAVAWASVINRYSAPTTYASDLLKVENPKDIANMFNGPQMRIMSFAATWASTDGDIGITYNGGVYQRTHVASRRAHDGTTSAADWQRRVPFAEYPHIQNPACGYVAQANQISAHGAEDTFGDVYVPGLRARRIHQLLEGYKNRPGPKARTQDFHKMQNDRLSLLADDFRCGVLQQLLPSAHPKFIEARALQDLGAPQQYSTTVLSVAHPVRMGDVAAVAQECIAVNPELMKNDITKYMSLLLTWDCVMDPRSAMPTLYQTWLQVTGELLLNNTTKNVRTAFLGRELDSLFVNRMEFDNHLAAKVVDLLAAEPARFKDLVGVSPAELLCTALYEALKVLSARYGVGLGDLAKEFAVPMGSALMWGDVQNFYAPHAMHDELPPLRQTLSIGPVRNMGGDFSTIYSIHWPVHPMLNSTVTGTSTGTESSGTESAVDVREALKFAQKPSIPVYRMVVDLGNSTNSEWSLFGGVSGWPATAHYSDFARSWLADESVQMPWDLDSVVQNAVTTTKMVPKKVYTE